MAKKKTNNKIKNNKNVSKDIKDELSKICILSISIIVFILLILFFPKNESLQIKLQIIEYDNKDNSEEVVKTYQIKEDEIIKLNKYNGNDIKIVTINEENVVISRDALRYEIISQDGPYSGQTANYIQTVIEKIDYDTVFGINIDQSDPFGPEYSQPRFHYTAKFTK